MSQIGAKYRVYCETDSKWEHTAFLDLDDGKPTTCPVNGAHDITAAATSIIRRVGTIRHLDISCQNDASPYKLQATKDAWKDCNVTGYEGTDSTKSIWKFLAEVASSDVASVDISIRIQDVTNGTTLATKANHTPATDNTFEIVDLGTVSNLPSAKAVLCLQIKKHESGSTSKEVRTTGVVGYI